VVRSRKVERERHVAEDLWVKTVFRRDGWVLQHSRWGSAFHKNPKLWFSVFVDRQRVECSCQSHCLLGRLKGVNNDEQAIHVHARKYPEGQDSSSKRMGPKMVCATRVKRAMQYCAYCTPGDLFSPTTTTICPTTCGAQVLLYKPEVGECALVSWIQVIYRFHVKSRN
jgi:hypothetical protein